MGKKLFFLFAVFLHAWNTFAETTQAPADLTETLGKLSSNSIANKPLLVMMVLIAISLLPFAGMLLTSFVKIAVVLSLTRQAIGTQQAPPNTVITGLAIILTIYVMHPVGMQIYEKTEKYFQQQNSSLFDMNNADTIYKAVITGVEPLKSFLKKTASKKNVLLFYNLAYQMRQGEAQKTLKHHDMIVLVPAFIISELTKAFQIGFLIFLPFLIIDMVVGNILMALGMQMLSPVTVSLPFKILLFVMVDGWYLIAKGLITGY